MPAWLLYDIHVEANEGWGDIGIDAPYILRWGRKYDPKRCHPYTRDLTFYRLVVMMMRP